jgi:hypothetical protein
MNFTARWQPPYPLSMFHVSPRRSPAWNQEDPHADDDRTLSPARECGR